MRYVNKREKCTGCRLCEKICTKRCISMEYDEEGFMIPVINEDKCINCNLCVENCPQNKEIIRNEIKKIYAARLNCDCNELKKSSSGGAFMAFAKYTISKNGVVFGAVYDENLEVKHISIKDENELYKMQGSKYVQSNTLNTYEEAKEYLENGTMVLYSGTPCQVEALNKYLGKEYSNLITIDLICHGVPSPKLFKSYINWLSRKEKQKIIEYNFRDKSKDCWGSAYRIKIRTEEREKFYSSLKDPYVYAFALKNNHRLCCYKCKYKSEERVGDITLGDYWGIQKIEPKAFDGKGVSKIILNTNKGVEIFNKIEKELIIYYSASDVRNISVNKKEEEIPKLRNKIYDGYKSEHYFEEKLKARPKFKNIIISKVPTSLYIIIKRYFSN